MEIHSLLLSLGMGGADAADVMVVFCPGRLAPYVSMFGLVHGGAFDLRDGWDLSNPEHVAKAFNPGGPLLLKFKTRKSHLIFKT